MPANADAGNSSNLTQFRRLLSELPEDVSKLDQSAAEKIEQLKEAYAAMTKYQQDELTSKEKARYEAIISAKLAPAGALSDAGRAEVRGWRSEGCTGGDP